MACVAELIVCPNFRTGSPSAIGRQATSSSISSAVGLPLVQAEETHAGRRRPAATRTLSLSADGSPGNPTVHYRSRRRAVSAIPPGIATKSPTPAMPASRGSIRAESGSGQYSIRSRWKLCNPLLVSSASVRGPDAPRLPTPATRIAAAGNSAPPGQPPLASTSAALPLQTGTQLALRDCIAALIRPSSSSATPFRSDQPSARWRRSSPSPYP